MSASLHVDDDRHRAAIAPSGADAQETVLDGETVSTHADGERLLRRRRGTERERGVGWVGSLGPLG